MQPLLGIAYTVVKETLRNKIYQGLFLFVLILIVTAKLFSTYTLGEEVKIIKDIGTGGIALFNLLFVIFTASVQLPNEFENRTIYTVLANPIKRWQFLLGKFLGINIVLFLNIFIMTGMLFTALAFKEGGPWTLLNGILLISMQCSLISSICLVFSTVAPYGITISAVVVLYLLGHLLGYLYELIDTTPYAAVKTVLNLIYILLPHFENFHISDYLAAGMHVSAEYVITVVVYGLLYSSIMISVAAMIFAEKEV